MNSVNKNTINNTVMLYILTFAKLVLPLLTFPYLTRVLSVSSYGQLTYVKSCTNYMQLVVDFGFLLSATKDIARIVNKKEEVSEICSRVTFAKIILSFICFIVYVIMIIMIPILNNNVTFSILSIFPIILSIFLFDYYFRGIEKMHILTIRFIIVKIISTVLTLLFVKSDNDLILIPIFDILSSFVAIGSTILYLKKENIHIYVNIHLIKSSFNEIKRSAVYFFSDIASTAFTLINTFLIGLFLTADDVAYWGVAYTLISAVQSMYNPISNGIYPTMVKTKSFGLIKKVLYIFIPITIAGVIFCYFSAPMIINIINGSQYYSSVGVFRGLLLVLLFGFPAIILGWPTLGAIDREKEVTFTTILSAIIHVTGLCILILLNRFNIYSIAITRSITEFFIFILRAIYVFKYRNEFSD